MAQPQTETPAPQPVPASVPYAPAPTPPIASVPDPKTPAKPRATKKPAWYTKPQFVAVGGLLLLILLLLGYRFLGLIVLAVIVLVLLVIGFFAALAWRRKGRNAARNGGRTAPRAARSGGLGARLAAMRSGRATRTSAGGPARSGGTGGRMAGLRSKLPRALGGTKGRSTGAGGGPGRTTSGGAGRSSRNPFSRSARAARTAKRTSSASGRSGNGTGSPGKSTGGINSGGRRGISRRKGSSSGGSGGGRRGIFGRKSRSSSGGGASSTPGAKPGTKASGSGSKSTSSPARKKAGELTKAFWGGVRDKVDPPKRDAKPDPKTAPTGTGRPPGSKPSPSHRNGDPKQPAQSTAPQRPAAPAGPKHSAPPNTNTGGSTMTDIQYSDDQSLQRWGANLGGASAAADEVARLFAEAEAAKARFGEVFGKIANQAESELPTSPTLLADVQGVKVKADQAASSDAWRAVAAEAEQLPAVYRREHETDQDRLDSPRGGLAQEKRADVTTASQDN